MQLFVNGSSQQIVELADDATVQMLRDVIASIDGIPQSEQYLVAQGHLLEEGLLSANGVSNLSVVSVCSRLLGGKVHGSLARAGKVKGQTPKVEKQPKKKSKTGRAKRRQQFAKRFNVSVAPGGKKKGPNCQNVATI